ncbi:molybdopterin molybdotransferase MoeA [Ancylobacter dichloromethanicus]|uniref:Molybdopterin molybdenumtransferase n=1 Tax=Ancylobacter dichloromethanicus TaxID=518825 RepID=A0A9W6J8I4_9HYPH|nr:gephyrin-like molybdotransferase Glp [Ancylobacter dichloromethanicus]MBS7554218.1 molybdopterin molybdotransferase MoeA [Ancylobacter dichloromethanicus]GLK71339.1 molybdopterin molybdenumtransferase MoeA [Ancylobacter dichloromethanicus]
MALMPVEEALALLLSTVQPLAGETVPLEQAAGRALAAPVVARRTTPGADVSAMDGYALRATDAATVPATLELIGESAAGRPFPGRVEPGTTVRIFTGAVLPEGADAIVIQEDTSRDGDAVTMTEAATPGRHIRRAGGDFTAGETLLEAGRRLRARDLALIAAADVDAVSVARRPRVGLISTGDELVRPGAGANAHQVIVSNIYSVAALARAAGAEVIDLGILPDRMDATQAGVRAALDSGFDVLVTTGGASVGDHDLIAPALSAEGVDLAVHRIALRPGKPLMFGRSAAARTQVLGLPGNPVSAHVCALLFLVPLIKALQGLAVPAQPELEPARLATDVKANEQRMDFMRAEIVGRAEGLPLVRPMPVQDSSMLRNLARADVLLVRRPHAPSASAGDMCEILRLED